MGVMGARRLGLGALVCVCVFACVLVVSVGSAAAAPLFGAPSGSEASEVAYAHGMAVDRASGDMYVGDTNNDRVDEFEASGRFVLAWGWGVLNGANEMQTCTTATGCQRGRGSVGAGGFADQSGVMGVAVDNELGSLSYGDVYVVDWSNDRVQKFDSSGKFLLMFGGHVNETTGGNVCAAGEACKRGTQGAVDGEFEWAYERAYIAVGPGGAVYVGDKARVQVFEASGAWRENISLAGLSTTGEVTALAVDGSGDVYVADRGVSGVHVFGAGGVEKAFQLDQGSDTVEAIATDVAGNVYVEDIGGGVHFLEFDPSGAELESFGSKVLMYTLSGMVFDEASGGLLVYGSDGSGEKGEGVWGIPVPPVGPLLEPGSAVVIPELRGAVSFEATVIPEGHETTARFEYVTEAQYRTSGFASASSTSPVSIGSGFEDRHVEARLPVGTLVPGATYHWRLVATDTAAHTIDGADQSFEEFPPARIEGPWAANVASTSATLAARIDPLGANTTYRLEWGTSAAYGHVFNGSVGEGMEYVPVGGYHIQGLEPRTTYHYRVVTASEVGVVESADHTFTTQIAGEELTLPDGRAWELVSPANKKGALIEPFQSFTMLQASAGGGAIAYQATDALGENAVGKNVRTQVLSTRGPNGWRTEDLTAPESLPPEGAETGELALLTEEYSLFSSNLSLGVIEQVEEPAPALSGEATEKTPYLRNDPVCASFPGKCYTPLVTPGNVEPSGTKFGGVGGNSKVNVVGATPDLSHVVVQSPYALIAGAKQELREKTTGHERSVEGPENLYEWSAGRLQLVNVNPQGVSKPGASLGLHGSQGDTVAHAVSDDGRRVVWSYGTVEEGLPIELFVRDMVKGETMRVGGNHAYFQTMSSDGSRVFFREHGELYELNVDTGVQSDLTANHGAGEANAGVQEAILGASEDGSYVYFVATGVLANGAASGADNLYVMHDGANGWGTTYIATLSSADAHSWSAEYEPTGPSYECDCQNAPGHVSSRVSPDGRFVAFMSSRSLTGYDTTDAVSGQPDEEVYLYDAVANRLVCASCNPTGARPVGVLDTTNGGGGDSLTVDRPQTWGLSSKGDPEPHWIAGFIPGSVEVFTGGNISFYQPRYLSDSGRLFFESPDALVPQATNGLMDVYEYEPVGMGGADGCLVSWSTFSENTDGCVSLISAGTSSGESVFYDASETGDDVFFTTTSKLVGEDYDTAYDMYDAHVCSASAPCPAVSVSPPPCTSGDSCKAAPAAQPELFGPAPSATFSGVGNVTASSSAVVAKPRALTRAQRLARALKACRKEKSRGKRAVCERRARKSDAARRSRGAKATMKGNG
jgi:hypothetical protein